MRFEEVLPALRTGKKIRRKAYPPDNYICLEDNVLKAFISYLNKLTGEIKLMPKDLLADDWEIVKETKKVKLRDLTKEQYSSRLKNYCNLHCTYCRFKTVLCDYQYERCWFNHKNLYSDKFLDQEIEVVVGLIIKTFIAINF